MHYESPPLISSIIYFQSIIFRYLLESAYMKMKLLKINYSKWDVHIFNLFNKIGKQQNKFYLFLLIRYMTWSIVQSNASNSTAHYKILVITFNYNESTSNKFHCKITIQPHWFSSSGIRISSSAQREQKKRVQESES